ncbi:lytic murein transglycosylase [Sagittula salina]|uniref:Lytic murein transglycosylase n=1 Tax=Sagittula salina TaxID=2820268 RepID=A0A940MRN5_9RHOB|nr:lytic murein transglycosylase [Sagittula salina]MBP0483556.1 lytic murein transglycosylase [Sagittula salina]
MNLDRRMVLLGAAALGLAGCGGAPTLTPARSGGLGPEFRPQPNASYDAWVAAFRGRAQARGITPATLDAAFRGAGYLPGVVERDRNQTEFSRSLEDYFALVAPEEKVGFGRRAVAAQRGALEAVSARYGVEADVIAAIWGVESYFGTRKGEIPVISSTSTLAWEGRRGAFFESNLMDALRIIQAGDARPQEFLGSWAGASGHTQVMPNAFMSFAVDADGNGRRDVWGESPVDAFGTTANYLARSGWRKGQPWGLEVLLPQGFSAAIGKGVKRNVAEWRALGVEAARGTIPDAGQAAVLAPMGIGRPAFMVFRNFEVILRYNPSENYGLGVGYLAARLAGGGPLQTDFGPDRYGLTLSDRQALQRGLTRAGFDSGTPDGVLGAKTEAAIRAWQQARGQPITGQPSRALLLALG